MAKLNTFPYKESLKFGWEKFKKHAWLLIAIMAVSGVVSSSFQYKNSSEEGFPWEIGVVGAILAIVFFVLQKLIELGEIKILLGIHDGKAVKFSDLFSQSRLLWRSILADILYFLAVLGGFILLIVPGIILAIKFQYYKYLIVDRDLGVIDSLKESSKLTEGMKWRLFLFGLLLALVNILGALALLVGLFVSVPVTMLANTYIFRKLQNETPRVKTLGF